ncbi:MBL fold metallo-hydrolase [Thorsellia kenyensis]|uniref:MBL fold metallo-hydrolase n=1 Tax=Thorsellia kenyensis TaxID=1549888 RepID=A0ABV6CCL9_9GAMM
MSYLQFPVTPFEQNCSLVWCEQTRKAVIIDPGSRSLALENAIIENNLIIAAVLLTHGHWDHAGAGKLYADKYQVPINGPHFEDKFLLECLPDQAARFGLSAETEAYEPTSWLNEGDVFILGELTFEILHCPGHTPGHIVFVEKNTQHTWAGDVLFRGSVGRTDFPRSNSQDLIQSIKNKLLPLGQDMRIFPGHGPMTTIGIEEKSNPFLK